MDLFGQFNAGLIAAFTANAYLSDGVAAQLFALDSDQETEEERLTTINRRLNLVGVAGSLASLDLDRLEGDRMICKGGLFWEVNKKKNLSSTGTNKPGRLIFQESISILQRRVVQILDDATPTPNAVNPFSQILINWAKRLGEDEGVEIWGIEFETKLAI